MNIIERYLNKTIPISNLKIGDQIKILGPKGIRNFKINSLYEVSDIEICNADTSCAKTCTTGLTCIWLGNKHCCDIIIGNSQGIRYK
jgi:hypothetical protein